MHCDQGQLSNEKRSALIAPIHLLQFRGEEVSHQHHQLSIRVCANWCDVNNNVNMRGRNAVDDKAVNRDLLVQTAFGIVPSTRSCRRCRTQALVEGLAMICILPSRNVVATSNIRGHAWTFRVRTLACQIKKTPFQSGNNTCQHPLHQHLPVGDIVVPFLGGLLYISTDTK